MTFTRNRRVVAALVAGSCLALPASASADPLPSTHRSDAAQAGYSAPASAPASLPSTHRSDAAQAGYAGTTGDQPTTIEVVHPERTIVRDVDEALPLILSSTALLLVLAGFGVVMIRTRMAPRAGR